MGRRGQHQPLRLAAGKAVYGNGEARRAMLSNLAVPPEALVAAVWALVFALWVGANVAWWRHYRRIGPGRVLPGLPVSVLLAVVATIVAGYGGTVVTLMAAKAAIRSRGEPPDLTDLRTAPSPPDQNAWVGLATASRMLTRSTKLSGAYWPERYLGDLGKPAEWDEAGLDALRAELAQEAAALAIARAAARTPACQLPATLAPVSVVADCPRVAALLEAAALVHVAEGRWSAATTDVVEALALADHLEAPPASVDAKRFQYGMYGAAVRPLEALLAQPRLSPADLARLQSALARSAQVTGLQTALVNERAAWLTSRRALPKSVFLDSSILLRRTRPHVLGEGYAFEPSTELLYLQRLEQLIELAGRPYWQAGATAHQLVQRWEQQDRQFLAGERVLAFLGGGPTGFPVSPIAESFGGIPVAMQEHAWCVSWLQVAWLAVGVRRFEARTGALPTRLRRLGEVDVRSVPVDPFTGCPFTYRVTDGGRAFMVYGTGPDQDDDGGVTSCVWGEGDVCLRGWVR